MASLLMFTVQGSSLKWSIDWDSQSNLLSGSYLSKDLLRRIIKLDNILQQRIIKLESEITVNFHILLGITSLMGIVLVLVASNFYEHVSSAWIRRLAQRTGPTTINWFPPETKQLWI